jgi:hypothetical protein
MLNVAMLSVIMMNVLALSIVWLTTEIKLCFYWQNLWQFGNHILALATFGDATINIKRKYRLLKVCYVHTTSSTFFPFLLQPQTSLMRQTRQAVHAINKSIFLRCLWLWLSGKVRENKGETKRSP